jgi:hypothetical protein
VTPSNTAGTHAPSGPPPSVTSGGDFGAWTFTGLPAVARGGEVTLVPVEEDAMSTAERNPVLDLEVRTRGDHTTQTIKVTGVGGFVNPDEVPAREKLREQQVVEANKQLVAIHGDHDLVPMHELALQDQPETDQEPYRHVALGDGLAVDWRGYHLFVFQHDLKGRLLADVAGSSWAAPPQPPPMSCGNPDYVQAIYHAPGINTVVVKIGYKGNDSCWEPAPTFHVVSWQ